ncbi:MAG: phosphoribosylglycinamide formyltransferase [Clostridia bacterium]|nr:phosphoribosylglycinamide formyltransferase [Clostridia bacterium]
MRKNKARVAVLVSGGGTNLQAIIDAQKNGVIRHGEVRLVIANKADAYALTRARNAGIPTLTVLKKECGGQREFEEKIAAALEMHQIDLIVLAGFMAILSKDFTGRFERKIINVHPSLIPSFCGAGFYGLRVHEAALAKGVKVTGATVHFVNEIPDGGEIILQKAVKVYPHDTPQKLQLRVMKQAEWKILPAAVEMLSAKIIAE